MLNQIYIFGESLSDSGNIFTVSTAASQLLPTISIAPPSPPYFQGRFADGPIWVDEIAQYLNLNLVPATTLSIELPIVARPTGDLAINSLFNGATTAESVNFALRRSNRTDQFWGVWRRDSRGVGTGGLVFRRFSFNRCLC